MPTSRLARRRRQLGALVVGLCVAAGSIGTAALADSGTSSSTAVSVDASVLVQAGMNAVNARQAASKLDAAIDSGAQTMARAAATAIPSRAPVRTTAAATKAFAKEVDAALTDLVVHSVPALSAAGAGTDALAAGTLAALAQVVRTIPGAIAITTGAEIAVASGADGTSASASLNPKLTPALRQTISDSVSALRPVLPVSRTTLRTVAAGVRQIVDASVVAVNRIVRATVDLAAAVVNVTASTLQAARSVADSAVVALNGIVTVVDATLDNLSDVNISAQVDASLGVSAH
ncbi:MAG TPA: hypothetical protein VGR20_16555 [Acidimicrobiia bacterium]|nr:hypothetical protein [Acidimicrobiia bacterium]